MEPDEQQSAPPDRYGGPGGQRGGHDYRGQGQPRGQFQRGNFRGRGQIGGHRGGHHEGGKRSEDGWRGRGRGRGPRGRGGRTYDDTKAYFSMQESEEVRDFFNKRELKLRYLDQEQFQSIIDEAMDIHSSSPELRHQFIIRLTQCKLFEMDGPIVGTIMKTIQKPAFVVALKEGICSMLDIFDELLYKIPHARNVQTLVSTTLDLLGKVSGLDDETRTKIQELKTRLEDPSLLLSRIKDPKQEWPADLSFIKESIIPEIGTLLNESLDERFFNPTVGGYTSPAHYLETWFRLMREDFLGPVRKAVKDFQVTFKPTDRMMEQVRLDGGYHYTVQNVAKRDEVDGESMVLAEYATEELEHVNWETTDRLRGDSFMVISNDHFQTARYAMIAYHDNPPAERGEQVWLKMLGGPLPMTWFHGIEPMAYFEPVRCVMERLKVQAARIHEEGVLPMSRYLVETNKTVLQPDYMIDGHQNELKLPGGEVTSVQNPDISTLGLDYSQEDAMHLALKHELALIQGPPGTGKSFVGAMFVHIMMLNKQLWQKHEHGCMLLLAYKNHAIDQFISECERMGMDMSRTVRIGSRSCTAMDKYQLIQRRRELQDRFEYNNLVQAGRTKRREIEETEAYIKELESVIGYKNTEMSLWYYMRFLPDEMMHDLGSVIGNDATEETVFAWICNKTPKPGSEKRISDDQISLIDKAQPLQEEVAEQIVGRFRRCLRIPVKFRAGLFAFWCQQVRDEAYRLLVDVRIWHRKLTNEMQQIRHEQDIAVVRRADIIAMTTTGASKHGHLVDTVKPTIVLCEEAAEVLESHIVAPLTDGCKHLVLIGDHQQLRPAVANFDMEKRNLNISLFERLITNGLPSRRLKIQHRMHPEIASLLVPHIYDSLDNHESVKMYPPVKGIEQRMHFFCHENEEEMIGEKSSRRNPYEADYMVGLCHYLLNQGYGPRDITILATYLGQMRFIREKMKMYIEENPEPTYTLAEQKQLLIEDFKDLSDMESSIADGSIDVEEMDNKTRVWLKRRQRERVERQNELGSVKSKMEDVRVTTVDNYQGEECTIILLSFVRSNSECNIGFLKRANRICVALSRARHGFYAIGNFNLFARHQKSDLWKKLCQQLLSESPEKLTSKLVIRCQLHSTVRYVSQPEEFLKLAPSGGCAEKCDTRLSCGHACTRMCHPTDRDHSRFICEAFCLGKLPCGHDCGRRCDQMGDVGSYERVSDGSRVNFTACLQCAKNIKCEEPVEMNPECGHTGMTTCYLKEDYLCMTTVEFSLPCGHPQDAACSSEMSSLKCERMITQTLACGHDIEKKCCMKNPICLTVVTQTMSCGHERTIECHRRDVAEECLERVDKELPCGHSKSIYCHRSEARLKCMVDVPVTFECGHTREIPCCYAPKNADQLSTYHDVSLKKEYNRCIELVSVKLPCEHTIEIACHRKNYPGPCTVKVTETLPCGHETEVPCHYKRKSRLCKVQISIERECGHTAVVRCWEKDRLPPCSVKVPMNLPCGHEVNVECGQKYLTPTCLVTKTETLKCGHTLVEKCSLFDKAKADGCFQSVQVNKSCGHRQTVECREQGSVTPTPCGDKCLVQCSHGTLCPRQCRLPCRRCPEPCRNQCPHSRCTRLCWEDCDRRPCDKPCPRVLTCGHPCSGFCGELCPKICTQCNPNARKGRRIRVWPCDHDFAMKMLDKHMQVRENNHIEEVIVKLCPLKHCKRPIMYCNRYMNQIKRYTKLTKLERYTGRGSWWYCKKGGHYMKTMNDDDLQELPSHSCTAYREFRPDDFYMEDDEVPEEREDDRGLVELRRLMEGQGFGRGAFRRGPSWSRIVPNQERIGDELTLPLQAPDALFASTGGNTWGRGSIQGRTEKRARGSTQVGREAELDGPTFPELLNRYM